MTEISGSYLFSLDIEGQTNFLQSVTGVGRTSDQLKIKQSTEVQVKPLINKFKASDIQLAFSPDWLTTPGSYKKRPVSDFHFEVEFIGPGGRVLSHAKRVEDIGLNFDTMSINQSTRLKPVQKPKDREISTITFDQLVAIDDNVDDDLFYQWIKQTGDWAGHKASIETGDFIIRVLDRSGETQVKWVLRDCYPEDYTIGDLDANKEQPLLRSLVVQPNNIKVERNPTKSSKMLDWVDTIFDYPQTQDFIVNVYDRVKAARASNLPLAAEALKNNDLGKPVAKLYFEDVWPKKYTAGNLDAKDGGLLIDKATVHPDGISVL